MIIVFRLKLTKKLSLWGTWGSWPPWPGSVGSTWCLCSLMSMTSSTSEISKIKIQKYFSPHRIMKWPKRSAKKKRKNYPRTPKLSLTQPQTTCDILRCKTDSFVILLPSIFSAQIYAQILKSLTSVKGINSQNTNQPFVSFFSLGDPFSKTTLISFELCTTCYLLFSETEPESF